MALPVLKSLTETDLEHGFFQLGNGTARDLFKVDMNDDAYHDVLKALQDARLVHIDEFSYAGGGTAAVLGARVTGQGLQALGQWPQFNAMTTPDVLADLLEQLKQFAPDAASESQVGRAAEIARNTAPALLRETFTSFTAALIRAKTGL